MTSGSSTGIGGRSFSLSRGNEVRLASTEGIAPCWSASSAEILGSGSDRTGLVRLLSSGIENRRVVRVVVVTTSVVVVVSARMIGDTPGPSLYAGGGRCSSVGSEENSFKTSTM
jgi:hypothetical protein